MTRGEKKKAYPYPKQIAMFVRVRDQGEVETVFNKWGFCFPYLQDRDVLLCRPWRDPTLKVASDLTVKK